MVDHVLVTQCYTALHTAMPVRQSDWSAALSGVHRSTGQAAHPLLRLSMQLFKKMQVKIALTKSNGPTEYSATSAFLCTLNIYGLYVYSQLAKFR